MPFKDPEKSKAWHKAWWEANRDKQKLYEANRPPRDQSAYQAQYYRRTKEARADKRKSESAAYYEKNKAKVLARTKSRRDADRIAYRDQQRVKVAEWRAANPEANAAIKHNRRGREREAGSFTKAEWAAVLEMYGHRCRWCACDGKMSVDHIVALAKGGSNTIENLQPLCPTCNTRKNVNVFDGIG